RWRSGSRGPPGVMLDGPWTGSRDVSALILFFRPHSSGKRETRPRARRRPGERRPPERDGRGGADIVARERFNSNQRLIVTLVVWVAVRRWCWGAFRSSASAERSFTFPLPFHQAFPHSYSGR